MSEPPDAFAILHDAIAGLRARRIFFIGGMPKSGTTWLQLLLDAHPDISCRGEGHFCNSLEPLLRRAVQRQNAVIDMKNTHVFRDIGGYQQFSTQHQDYLLVAAMALLMAEGAGTASIVGEKTPDNLIAFPRLRELFPTARFVMMLRDGRDCAVSGWYHNLRLNEKATRERFPTFNDYAHNYAQAWGRSVEGGLRFAATHPDHCAVISYEGLLDRPESALTRLLGFLGARADADVLRACIAAADFTRLSGGRAPGQEDRSSLFRLGVAGDWRRHFDSVAAETFETVAGATLRRCGYAPWVPDTATIPAAGAI